MAATQVDAIKLTPTRRVSRLFGHFIIKQRFQFKFTLMVLLFLGIATLSIWYFGTYTVKKLVETEAIKNQDAILQLENINSLIFKIAIIYMAVASLLSLFFSHLVAGPIYRFEKTLEELRAGNLTVFIKLRKRDEFKDTAELFNQTISALRTKVQKDRDVVNVASDRLKIFSEKLKLQNLNEEAAELDKLVFDLRNTPPQLKI